MNNSATSSHWFDLPKILNINSGDQNLFHNKVNLLLCHSQLGWLENLFGLTYFWTEFVLALVEIFFWLDLFFLVGTIWDQEKGSRGKRFPYYFNWKPFFFLIEIFYNTPNKFEKHQCEHNIRGFGFAKYHYVVHMCL